MRCGINTSIIYFIMSNYYTTVHTVSPEQPRIRASANHATAQFPQGLGSPPNSLLRLRETPYMTLLAFPALYQTSQPLSYPPRAGIPNTKERANTPSRTRPETPASPTRMSTRVTGTLHTRFSVNLSKCRPLPDSTAQRRRPAGQSHFSSIICHRSLARLHIRTLSQSYTFESHINSVNSDNTRNYINSRTIFVNRNTI